MFSNAALRDVVTMLRPLARHTKFLEGYSRGYVLLDVTPDALAADWMLVPSVKERSDRETRGGRFVCERGSSSLVEA
jgi:alkaline phosphatase D